jgi:hypothetical protein
MYVLSATTRHCIHLTHLSTNSIYLFISLTIYSPFLDLGRFFGFLILYTGGMTPWTGDQPVARPLPAHRTTQTQNKRKQTSMSRVTFETTIPVIPVFERVKTVHASHCAATVVGFEVFIGYTRMKTGNSVRPYVVFTTFNTN